jgi:hypothetical protein
MLGTVLGAILVPILNAIYVNPLFYICDSNSFADYLFIPKWNKNVQILTRDMEREIEAITKWLKQSGLKVNKEKTDIYMFNKYNVDSITIKVNDVKILSKNHLMYLRLYLIVS